jgi:hypothetical protein
VRRPLGVTFRPIDLRDRAGAVVARALVDKADAHLADKPWYRLRNGYAVRTEIANGKKRMVYMHREVLGLSYGDRSVVDHINGDKLDNRRRNLRVVSQRANTRNRAANRGRRLPRNVYPSHSGDAYRVQVKVEGSAVHIGTFATLDRARTEAVRARIRYGLASQRDLHTAKHVLVEMIEPSDACPGCGSGEYGFVGAACVCGGCGQELEVANA